MKKKKKKSVKVLDGKDLIWKEPLEDSPRNVLNIEVKHVSTRRDRHFLYFTLVRVFHFLTFIFTKICTIIIYY